MPGDKNKPGYSDQTVRVDKAGLDPFGAERQALNMVRRESPAPTPPNADRLEYEVEDRGDHFEIGYSARRRQGGPKGSARVMGGRGGEPPGGGAGREKTGEGLETMAMSTSGRDQLELPGGGMLSADSPNTNESFDVEAHLQKNYTAPELMDVARQNGIHAPRTTDKRDLALAIADKDPLLARRLVGR